MSSQRKALSLFDIEKGKTNSWTKWAMGNDFIQGVIWNPLFYKWLNKGFRIRMVILEIKELERYLLKLCHGQVSFVFEPKKALVGFGDIVMKRMGIILFQTR